MLSQCREESWAPGLRCFEGRCWTPCDPDESTSCPEGFSCAADLADPMCLPACETQGCPSGQQCVQLTKEDARPVPACLVLHGENCRRTPCPEGQLCLALEEPHRPGEMWMACRQRCGKDQPACPEGLVCNHYFCRQPCDPQTSGQCGPAERCGQYSPGSPWVCQPDF